MFFINKNIIWCKIRVSNVCFNCITLYYLQLNAWAKMLNGNQIVPMMIPATPASIFLPVERQADNRRLLLLHEHPYPGDSIRWSENPCYHYVRSLSRTHAVRKTFDALFRAKSRNRPLASSSWRIQFSA